MRATFLIMASIFLVACGQEQSTVGGTSDDTMQPLSPIAYNEYIAIGEFLIDSPSIVISDPGYDLETARSPGFGAILTNCTEGNWRLFGIVKLQSKQGLYESIELLAHSDHIRSSELSELHWDERTKPIGGDYAMVGIYDLQHFHDDSIIPPDQKWTFSGKPADPGDLWYSMNCESQPHYPFQGFGPAEIPYGCVLHWDGGVRVSVGSLRDGKIVAIRLVTR